MKRWIRWQGLAAFVVLIAVMAFIWLVAVDWIAEKTIEMAGTRAVGARVDVGRADVTLFPAGVDVIDLEVTDPDQPMRNALAIKRLHAAMELPPLLRRKMIVNDMRIEGLRFNTTRSASGALPGKLKDNARENTPAIPPWLTDICGAKSSVQLSLPKVEDILGREPLQSLKLADDVGTKIDTAKASWQNRLNDLPSQADLAAYQHRVEKLKGSGGLASMLGSANEAKTLHADIKKDIKRIKDAHNEYQNELQALKKESKALVQAPALEAKRLQEKYALSPSGVANMSRLLFGPQVCGWWQKAHHWYQRVKPYMRSKTAKAGEPETVAPVRGKGLDVRFAETHPLPDFLIRNIHVDAQLDVGNLTGQIADITSQPHILGKPLTFKFLGRQLKQIEAVNLNGIVNLIQPEFPRHNVKMLIEKLSLKDLDLSGSDLPLSITQALTNLNMSLDLSGPKLDAQLKARMQDVKMALQEKATSELSAVLDETISTVRNFDVAAALKGTDPEYIATLDSDLDQLLQKAVGQMVQKAGAKLESQLQSAISEKVNGPISDVRNQLGGLDSLGKEFNQRLDIGNGLLKKIKLPF